MRSLLLAAALASPSSAASDFLEALRRAEARAAADPERVEYATRAIRAWTPGDGRLMLGAAHLRRAEGLLERGEETLAVEDLLKTVENDPANHRALLLRGRARLALRRHLPAESDLLAYTAARPEDPEGWEALALARMPEGGAGRPAEARKASARLRRLEPGGWRSEWLDGRSYLLERRPEAALAPLDRAVSAAKGARPEPLAERAQARAAMGRHAEAEQDWSAALPLLERAEEAATRVPSPPRARQEARSRAAAAFFARGRLREFLLRPEGAAADFAAACERGHAEACARRPAAPPKAAAKPQRPKPAAPEADPPEPVRPKAKKRRVRSPKSDGGARIYAN